MNEILEIGKMFLIGAGMGLFLGLLVKFNKKRADKTADKMKGE